MMKGKIRSTNLETNPNDQAPKGKSQITKYKSQTKASPRIPRICTN
jgi:hypothetical protein